MVAKSFKDWITTYEEDLIKGQLVYSEDYFGIINEDELDIKTITNTVHKQ